MSQDAVLQETAKSVQGDEHSHGGSLLGPLLCWAVVFADIGTSVYYVPGILYGTVGNLAGFFVFLTMSVFVLLTLKYAEVTHRFPQGGGVVTVAASALNKWAGALGGMFILVDYFLTASISSLSGMQYLSVVLPGMGVAVRLPFVGSVQLLMLFITIGVLVLLGILNWIGVSESAKVSLVGAIIAFISDLAILVTVFIHLSVPQVLSLFSDIFKGHALTPVALLTGFAGSFLAFSGLESISQLSPVMKTPRKKVAGMALFLVVITIGVTSPFLTIFSTLLQPAAAADPIKNAQLISLLGGHWGNVFLQTEIAISASALLVFASNTAIIGSYHVFMALSRLSFFPSFVLKRNKLRDTPHYSIMLATGIPIIVLLLVLGNITILGDMYAFGLLGAFTLTCLSLDIIRNRDRRAKLSLRRKLAAISKRNGSRVGGEEKNTTSITDALELDGPKEKLYSPIHTPLAKRLRRLWVSVDFWLGVITTGLVIIAWGTNLVSKPLATIFGGTVTLIGMTIAYFNYRSEQRQGQETVHVVSLAMGEVMPDAALALLLPDQDKHNAMVVRTALKHLDERPLAFLYVGKQPENAPAPQPFEYYEPYLYDEEAMKTFRRAEAIVRNAKVKGAPQYLYRALPRDVNVRPRDIVKNVWRTIHPHEIMLAADDLSVLEDINPDRIRYEVAPNGGSVAHLIARR